MKSNWKWWLADMTCIFLLALSLYHQGHHELNAVAQLNTAPKAEAQQQTDGSCQNVEHPSGQGSVGGPMDNNRESSGSKSIFKRQTGAWPLSKTYPNTSEFYSPAPAPADQQRSQLTTTELKECFENNDLRTALYCARDLISDASTAQMPHGHFCMGAVLYKMESFPECISALEHALELNEKSVKSPEWRYWIYRMLAVAYHRTGADDKAQHCVNQAYHNAQDQQKIEQLGKIKNIIRGDSSR
ncbi:MAG: tetratricopeptide repeat protein [Planctomycetota bacterium]